MRGVLTTSETKIIKPDTMKKECFEHKRNLSEGEKEFPPKEKQIVYVLSLYMTKY